MRTEQFSGYEALKLVELPKPTVTDGKVLVRITAAAVKPLDHAILIDDFHFPEKPLIVGNEGAGERRRPWTRQGVGLPGIVDGNGMVSDACCIMRESRFVAL
jgi:hypothetical protein